MSGDVERPQDWMQPEEADFRVRFESDFVTSGASAEYSRLIEEYSRALLLESKRLAASRQIGSLPEPIISNDVRDASRFIVRGNLGTSWQKNLLGSAGMAISFIAAVFSGFIVNYVDRPFGTIGLAITALIGTAGYVVSVLLGDQRRDERVFTLKTAGDVELQAEFLAGFMSLQKQLRRAADSKGLLDTPPVRSIGEAMFALEKDKSWTEDDSAALQYVLAVRNGIFHDARPPEARVITRALNQQKTLKSKLDEIIKPGA